MATKIILVRHAETEYNLKQLINGDVSVSCPLTPDGREAARRLGAQLQRVDIDLCVTSAFARTRETADLVLGGRNIARLVLEELNDPRAGIFESKRLADYLSWMDATTWNERPQGGGESQLDVVRRYCFAFESLVERSEDVILVICHAFPISFALSIAGSEPPLVRRRYAHTVDFATPYEVDVDRLGAALRGVREELKSITDSA